MTEDPIKILTTVSIPDTDIERIQAVSPRVELHVHPTRDYGVVPEELLDSVEILYTMYTLPEPDQVPSLRWIQAHTSGVDQFHGHSVLSH